MNNQPESGPKQNPFEDENYQLVVLDFYRDLLKQLGFAFDESGNGRRFHGLKVIEQRDRFIIRLDYPLLFPANIKLNPARLNAALAKSFANPEAMSALILQRYKAANKITNLFSLTHDIPEVLKNPKNFPDAAFVSIRNLFATYQIDLSEEDLRNIYDYLSLSTVKNSIRAIFEKSHLTDVNNPEHDVREVIVPISLQSYRNQNDEIVAEQYRTAKEMESRPSLGLVGAMVLRGDHTLDSSDSVYLNVSSALLAQRHPEIFEIAGGRLLDVNLPYSVFGQFITGLAKLQTQMDTTVGNLTTTTQLLEDTSKRFTEHRISKVIELSDPTRIQTHPLERLSSQELFIENLSYDIRSLEGFLNEAIQYTQNNLLTEQIDYIKDVMNWYIKTIFHKVRPIIDSKQFPEKVKAFQTALASLDNLVRNLQ